MIHLLSQILLTPDGGTVLIEEPETHLHPGAQVKLAAWLATHGSEHWKQLLITTHSEHLLAGLLWQVREGKLAADDIGVYRFSHDEEAGTEVEEVKVWQGGTVLDRGLRSLFKGPEEFSGYESFLLGLHESELLASTPQS